MKINFIDLKRQYQAYKDEIDSQIKAVIENTSFILGPQLKSFESACSNYVGVKHSIGCSSGTDALLLALRALNVKPGDEIITSPFSFIAAAEMIMTLNVKPIFVDIESDTFNINADLIESAITPKTRGILPINLFGQCCDFDKISDIAKKHNLFVIEDAAQSFGATYKNRLSCSLGDINCTSFFPAKPLGCFGDGGMVFTNNDSHANMIRSLLNHGAGKEKYDHVHIGLNARLDALQAAILSVKLKHFNDEIDKRVQIAECYTQNLAEQIIKPKILSSNKSVFAQYVIQTDKRDLLMQHLSKQSIPTAIHYPKAIHLQPAMDALSYKPGDFPVTERSCQKVLALPMHAFLGQDEQDFIIDQINKFFSY